jgi:hypothetical protein
VLEPSTLLIVKPTEEFAIYLEAAPMRNHREGRFATVETEREIARIGRTNAAGCGAGANDAS